MRHLSLTRRHVLSLLAALALALPFVGSAAPTAKPAEEATAKPAEGGTVEVKFTDDSHLKVKLRDEKIELLTPYGKLLIPVGDVRRIEFATRVADDTAKKIDTAVTNLGSNEFKTREAASAELTTLAVPAYPALVKAARNADAEVARRAQELLAKVREEVPAEQLETRPHDVIYTEHSKIAGRIQMASLKVTTAQFGDQPMRLCDVRCLYAPGAEPEAEATAAVEPLPDSMTRLQANIGKTYLFRVTGSLTGNVWGTDVYTTDSSLSAVAVHAGVLKPGQTAVVKVTILAPPGVFVGSTRNGVTSSAYPAFPGAYKVSRR
jgi:hypothetical protein